MYSLNCKNIEVSPKILKTSRYSVILIEILLLGIWRPFPKRSTYSRNEKSENTSPARPSNAAEETEGEPKRNRLYGSRQ